MTAIASKLVCPFVVIDAMTLFMAVPPVRAQPSADVATQAIDMAVPVSRIIVAVPDAAATAFRPYLAEMVDKALMLSPEVREAMAKWQAAEFDIGQAKGQRWPQVQLGANSPSAQFGGGNRTDVSNRGYGTVQVTTPLIDWGRIARTVDSRSETSKAAFQELEQSRQKISFDTSLAVLELLRNRAALGHTQGYVKQMASLVTMLSQIVLADAGRRSELTQARARLLQALSSRDQVIARTREAEVALYKLVGEEVELPAKLRWQSEDIALAAALDAAQSHPALLQSRAEASAAGFQADSVRASRWPQINWLVSKSSQPDSLGRTLPWMTSVGVQWNAFQGGSARAAEQAARERARAGEQRAQSVQRDLESRLRTSAEQRDAAQTRATQYAALIVETDRVRRAFFDQWYHLGKRTLLDVLIAESDYYNNQIARVNGEYDANAADLRMLSDSGLMLAWLVGAQTVTVPRKE